MFAARPASGDDVRQQLIFDRLDLILERQLLFLESPQQQLVRRAGRFERHDFVVEHTMFVAQLHKLVAQLTIVLTLLHWSSPVPRRVRPRFDRS